MKSIPIALANDINQAATTLCYLQKIGPTQAGEYICLTSLDRDVDYDDGSGLRTYYAGAGLEPSQMDASHNLEVDNSESKTLLYPPQGFTLEKIQRGELDASPFVVYRINYLAPTHGHEIMASGVIGEVRERNGLVTFENRALSQLMKQNSVVQCDSLTCRAKFGSQPGEERFPCMYDLTSEWVSGTVTAVGADGSIDFTASALAQATDYFAPGLVEWLTGDNSGLQQEIDAYTTGGIVKLKFSTRYTIDIGDTFRIRRDCSKWWSGHNSCQTFNNRQWFRGEPNIPVSDAASVAIPGVNQ